MRLAPLAVVAVAALAGTPSRAAAAPAPAPVTLVACAPGYPGTTAEAQPHMDAFAAALARAAGWPEGSVAAVYLPGEREGVARLAKADAAVALVPLPFLVEHGADLHLAPRMLVALQGGAGTETWTLLAKKRRVAKPADLAGFTVTSIAGYSLSFVRQALAGWGRLPAGVQISFSTQVLSSLRKAASGADVAVLLDGAQSAAVASLPFASDLETVARSEPLPQAFVATAGTRLPAARWKELQGGLERLASDPQGAAALEGIRMSRFAPADPAALAAVKRLGGERAH